ncbi:hypothetical protein AB0C95_09495 [Streptomyces caniferus]|uniref:hypothetical protein n=1 Tax=Streptomyces caniferus TaxID=285557 RepID=UPI0034011ECD
MSVLSDPGGKVSEVLATFVVFLDGGPGGMRYDGNVSRNGFAVIVLGLIPGQGARHMYGGVLLVRHSAVASIEGHFRPGCTGDLRFRESFPVCGRASLKVCSDSKDLGTASRYSAVFKKGTIPCVIHP